MLFLKARTALYVYEDFQSALRSDPDRAAEILGLPIPSGKMMPSTLRHLLTGASLSRLTFDAIFFRFSQVTYAPKSMAAVIVSNQNSMLTGIFGDPPIIHVRPDLYMIGVAAKAIATFGIHHIDGVANLLHLSALHDNPSLGHLPFHRYVHMAMTGILNPLTSELSGVPLDRAEHLMSAICLTLATWVNQANVRVLEPF